MSYLPSKLISEDAADITIKEYLCLQKGWKTAFYSSPCGSWSTIRFEINGFTYETFSPRDISRPDMVLYKVSGNKLQLLIIESKDDVNKFTKDSIKKYINSMSKFKDRLLKEKYRLVKNNTTGQFMENKMLPREYIENCETNIILLACSSNLASDLLSLKPLLPSVSNVFGLLVEVNWKNLTCRIQSVNDSSGEFNDVQSIEYSYNS